MSEFSAGNEHLTHALIHLDNLTHNVRLLEEVVGGRPLCPAIKANAYGHGAENVARHLVALGHDTLCVAHVSEAATPRRLDLGATRARTRPSGDCGQ